MVAPRRIVDIFGSTLYVLKSFDEMQIRLGILYHSLLPKMSFQNFTYGRQGRI